MCSQRQKISTLAVAPCGQWTSGAAILGIYFQYIKATPQRSRAMVAEMATQISSVMPNSKGFPGVSLCGRTSVMGTNVGLDTGDAQVTEPPPIGGGAAACVAAAFLCNLQAVSCHSEFAFRRRPTHRPSPQQTQKRRPSGTPIYRRVFPI